jgi:hypothetical protein
MTTTTTDRPNRLPVATIAAALFCVVLIYLALQIRAGQDPAIGAAEPAPAAARPVVVRRIVIRRIVEQPSPTAAAGGPVLTPAPVGSSAPVAAAPVAAAPAPAPAPVVSGGS